MVAKCPYCGFDMKSEGKSKLGGYTRYWCPYCGQHWTKAKGEKGYRKGQFR